MTSAEVRKRNNEPITDSFKAKVSEGTQEGKFITGCLKCYLNDTEGFKYYPKRIQEFVKKVVANANEGNSSLVDQVFNRVEGKVKDVIDMNMSMSDLRPDQKELQAMDKQFQTKPKEIDNQAAQIERHGVLNKEAIQIPYDKEKAAIIDNKGSKADTNKIQ